jgi:hypothetical protein
MRLSALNRLRLAFLGIGALLLLPLGLLAHSVTARLEAQRRLRHEVVAERIFDELERELTTVLMQEFARPSYDSPSMRVDDAPAYVLGYFTSPGGRLELLGSEARTESKDEKARRVRWAIGEWENRHPESVEAAPPGAAAAPPAPADRTRKGPAEPARQQVNPAPAPRSSPEILKRLNRGDQMRQESGY